MWTGLISPIMRGLGQAAARQAAQGLHSNNLRPTVTRNMRLALALVRTPGHFGAHFDGTAPLLDTK